MENGNKNLGNAEDQKKESNVEATEKMAANDERQHDKFQKDQNDKNLSEDPKNDHGSLSNNEKGKDANDNPDINEQNKKRMESEEDEDYGIETI